MDVGAAIAREREIKAWPLSRKLELLRIMNPGLEDLSKDWFEPETTSPHHGILRPDFVRSPEWQNLGEAWRHVPGHRSVVAPCSAYYNDVMTGSPGTGGPPRLWATRAIILVAFLDLFMQFPVVAPYARSLGASGTMAGVVVAAYSASNLLGNLVAGAVLDLKGRRWPLLIGLLATAIALTGYAVSATPQQLLVARSVHGLTAAVLAPGAFAILGDSTRSEQRARTMGLGGAFIAIAAVVGPPIAGIIRDSMGPEAVFLVVAALMLATLLLLGLSAAKHLPASSEHPSQGSASTGIAFLRRPRIMAAYMATLGVTIGLGILVTHLPAAMAARSESSMRTGLTFAGFAVAALIAMASPLNRLSDRLGRLRPMLGGLVLVAAGMLVLCVEEGFAGSVAGMGVFGLGFGVLFPAMTASVAEEAGRQHRGAAFGVFYAVFSLGVVIGSVASGLVADNLGATAVAPYLLGAVVALVAVPATTGIWRLRNGTTRTT